MTLVRRGSAQVACFFDRLAEANAIVEWVDDRHLHHSPFHLLETWPVMPIFFVVELAMQGRDLSHIDINDGTRGTVAVMLAQMEHQLIAKTCMYTGALGSTRCSQSTLQPRKSM